MARAHVVLNSVLETVHITNNLVPRRAKLSTTDVTAKTNLKPLVSVPVSSTLFVALSCAPTPPPLTLQLFLVLLYIFPGFLQDKTQNGRRNTKQNRRWSSHVSFQKAHLKTKWTRSKRDLNFDHWGFRFLTSISSLVFTGCSNNLNLIFKRCKPAASARAWLQQATPSASIVFFRICCMFPIATCRGGLDLDLCMTLEWRECRCAVPTSDF